MTHLGKFLLPLCCLLIPVVAPAVSLDQVQPPARLRIEAELDDQGMLNLRLSNRLRLTVTVEGVTPALPVRLIESPDWDVQAQEATTDTIDGKLRWRQTFLAAPRKPGSVLLQPRPLLIGDTTVDWKPMTVNVTTEVGRADLKELRDVLPPEPAPPEPPLLHWLAWTGGTVVGVLLLLSGWGTLRRLLARPLQPGTPAEEALRELRRIESLGLPVAGKYERYHTLVADTVRIYLEQRYQLRAPRQTTAEFLRSIQESPELTEAQRDRLRQFLERCDVVKFAGEQGTLEACAAAGTTAQAFITETAAQPRDTQARR